MVINLLARIPGLPWRNEDHPSLRHVDCVYMGGARSPRIPESLAANGRGKKVRGEGGPAGGR